MIEKTFPQYEAPVVVTYTNEEILEELGPARTTTSGGNHVPVIPPTTQ